MSDTAVDLFEQTLATVAWLLPDGSQWSDRLTVEADTECHVRRWKLNIWCIDSVQLNKLEDQLTQLYGKMTLIVVFAKAGTNRVELWWASPL